LPKENKQRKRVAIITQGTDPTIIAVQGEDNVKTFPVHAIEKSEINDTTGAGDAFAGGFFAGVARGESIETSVDMGSWLAALSLRELGPSYVLTWQTCNGRTPQADLRVDTHRPSRHTRPSDRLIEPKMPFQQLSTPVFVA
jgi:bifunctional ADP-heptose synthase (sugar kinase/adenylyltransferase)